MTMTNFVIVIVIVIVQAKRETYLAAKKEKKSANTRISEAVTYSERQKRPAEKEAERKEKGNRVESCLRILRQLSHARVMFAVIVKKEKGKQSEEMVIVVSKKVSPKATERNRVKRRIRAILAERCKEARGAYKVIVKPEAKNLTFKELRQEIEKQLS